jgi:glucosylglycerate synthase
MNNSTPLREITKELLRRVSPADLVVGIPCFNNGETVGRVVELAAVGLAEHFPNHRSCILIADGGSTMDDSREAALAALKKTGAHGVVGIYRGLPGKGSAVRMIFAAAKHQGAQAVALMDADLRSTSPLWVERLLGPVVNGGYHFVAPLYARYKFDGTITNNVTYNMLRCLFGQRIRQPIGGEFALSTELTAELEKEPVWTTDIARFGIDIWMTIQALVRGVKLCQTHLGIKVHDAKDPAKSLEPMFRQVVGTLFRLMEQTEDAWRTIHGSRVVDVWGEPTGEVPEAFPIDYDRLVESFYVSWHTLKSAWKTILTEPTFAELEIHMETGPAAFHLSTDLWARILFEFAGAFHRRTTLRQQVVEVLSPLYFARVASFINRTRELSNEQADTVVEEQARVFELRKPYLLQQWCQVES